MTWFSQKFFFPSNESLWGLMFVLQSIFILDDYLFKYAESSKVC